MGDGVKMQGSSGSGMRSGVVTLLIVAAISWGFLFLACRTKSGHDYVQAKVAARLGMDITVEKVALAPPFTLRLRNIQSVDYRDGESGFHADEANVRFGIRSRVKIDLLRPELHLIFDGKYWFPTNFAALGELPFRDLGAVSDVCAPWRDREALFLEGGMLYWHSRTEGVIASARGVKFSVRPVHLPGHVSAQFHSLRAASVVEPAGREVDNVVVEWLAVGDKHYIEIERSATLPAGRDAGFWGAGDDQADVH